jgi:predicted GNAT family N-acyltransferase
MDFLDIYAKLMAEGFKDDPGILIQFQGMEHGAELFEINCKCEIEAFDKLGCVTTYGNGEGMAIGYFAKDVAADEIAQHLQDSAHYLLESPYAHELSALQNNVATVAEIVKPDWYMKYTGNDNVFVLQVIVVQQSRRGTGVFRKLITPILDLTEQRDIPVVLQTHIYKNSVKFEHFGFQLMEEIRSDKVQLSCYNMMKKWNK